MIICSATRPAHGPSHSEQAPTTSTTGTTSISSGRSRRLGPTPMARQDQRQVGDELQAQLGEQQLGRQASVGNVAEDVHQDAAHADHEQDDQGSEETLDEIAQQVSVELQHGAVV
ncbi:hypothetical protein G6F22_015381 [Rhizopus arrhizus]|nr:hypothetical protein G6F22_015381 [Rhizopus arrhizus]